MTRFDFLMGRHRNDEFKERQFQKKLLWPEPKISYKNEDEFRRLWLGDWALVRTLGLETKHSVANIVSFTGV